MKKEEIWILGHKPVVQPSTGDYDLSYFESEPNVPGPPPHSHGNYHEFFMILEGEMEFMVDGEIKLLRAGESVGLAPGTTHTFNNKGSEVCKYINIHSPKGFMSFFRDFGVQASEENASEKSVSQEVVGEVIERAAEYDLLFEMPKSQA